jgi:hypothetical protein
MASAALQTIADTVREIAQQAPTSKRQDAQTIANDLEHVQRRLDAMEAIVAAVAKSAGLGVDNLDLPELTAPAGPNPDLEAKMTLIQQMVRKEAARILDGP